MLLLDLAHVGFDALAPYLEVGVGCGSVEVYSAGEEAGEDGTDQAAL